MRTRKTAFETIESAISRVQKLEQEIVELKVAAERYKAEANAMAKLAADGPVFHNPLHAAAAVRVRNEILKRCGLLPNGQPLNGGDA